MDRLTKIDKNTPELGQWLLCLDRFQARGPKWPRDDFKKIAKNGTRFFKIWRQLWAAAGRCVVFPGGALGNVFGEHAMKQCPNFSKIAVFYWGAANRGGEKDMPDTENKKAPTFCRTHHLVFFQSNAFVQLNFGSRLANSLPKFR